MPKDSHLRGNITMAGMLSGSLCPSRGFCRLDPASVGGIRGWLIQNPGIGEVMPLIRLELLFHEYGVSTQSCIESVPSDDLRNAENITRQRKDSPALQRSP